MVGKLDRWHAVAFGICLGWIAVLMMTSPQVGVPRDESFYLVASDFAANWYSELGDSSINSLSPQEINRRDRFGWNWEHPVLMKTAFGLSKRLFHDTLGWIDTPLLAYRLPTMLLSGLGLFLVFVFARFVGGLWAGFLAQGLFAFLPRMYFHSHLACFDMPVTIAWLCVVFCFIQARLDKRWIIPAGISLGLGFATKLNIFFLPFALLGFALLETGLLRQQRHDTYRAVLIRYALIGGSFIVVGGLVFWLHWPLLYHDTLGHIGRYIEFHARHVHYPVDYFGVLQYRPPFAIHFPLVMTLVSVPLMTLTLAGLGAYRSGTDWWMSRRDQWSIQTVVHGQVLLSAVVPILIIALPTTPIFGGTKHWMPAMPFFAILGGVGGAHLLMKVRNMPYALAIRCSVVCCMLSVPVWATYQYGSQGPAYYNSLVGGPPGAARLGLSRNFWGHSTVGVLDVINTHAEDNALVFWHKATQRSIQSYQRTGDLKKPLRYTGDWTAAYSDWAVYHTQQEKLPEEVDIWRAYGTQWPFGGMYIDGLEVMSVYRRPESRR